MKNKAIRTFVAALIAFGLSFPLVAGAPTPPDKPGPANFTKDPDISGVWIVPELVRNLIPNEDPPFTQWGKDKLAANKKEVNPDLLCFPPGVPRVWILPFPFEIIQLPGRVMIIYEQDRIIRTVYMDGRKHPDDENPTWMGNSIGHWEGDTLVVDTVGFNDRTWLDNQALPHSDALHMIERIHRVTHDKLQIDFTIDDPKAYTKPWTAQRTFNFKPDWELGEMVCEENNNYLFPTKPAE